MWKVAMPGSGLAALAPLAPMFQAIARLIALAVITLFPLTVRRPPRHSPNSGSHLLSPNRDAKIIYGLCEHIGAHHWFSLTASCGVLLRR